MAEIIFTHSYLLLILPLLGFVVIGLWMARKYPSPAKLDKTLRCQNRLASCKIHAKTWMILTKGLNGAIPTFNLKIAQFGLMSP